MAKKSGLKYDLIQATVKALKDIGVEDEVDISQNSYIERLAHYQTEAITKFITNANFSITEMKAPVILETLKTPDQPVDIGLETLLADKAPILKTLRQIGRVVPGAGQLFDGLVDELEASLRTAVQTVRKAGANFSGFDISKDGTSQKGGGLISQGYVYIGEDPTSNKSFDVSDEDGQRINTVVKFFEEDIESIK